MKKLTMMLLVLCCVIGALACGGEGEETVDGTTGATQQDGGESGSVSGGKMLVVYFSRAGENWQVGVVERGNTAIMVDYIQELADVDVFEIEPAVAYPEGYEACKEVATEEFNNNARPAIKTSISNLSDYETIFVGGPVWWSRPPMIFRTFFEAHPELDGKTVIPFGTHGGSGVGSYATLIREYYPNATILESLGISGSSIRSASSKTTVKEWLQRLGVDKESTSVRGIRATAANDGEAYSLNGIRTKNPNGIYIKNNKKYLNRK